MDVKTWSVAQVETFLSKNGFSESTITILKANEIDGESLILLNDADVASFGVKIGPVTKVRGLIQSFRQQKENIPNSPTDADHSQQAGNVIVNKGSRSSSEHSSNEKGINVISILKENKTGKEIVDRFMDRNEDFITHDERIAVVKIVSTHSQ